MKEVSIIFACGHEGKNAAALFEEGEKVPAMCRKCRPSKIVAFLWLGALAAFGATAYGVITWNVPVALGGVIGTAMDAFFLFIFSR